ncbi:hypothetical protein NKH10_30810 [Mesorhizobium sp. M1340]|uniref:hypothetical protein n=1 Tax=Mesorhizobium sp. M1340 TaxID=2957087 RepID=UPI00333CCE05
MLVTTIEDTKQILDKLVAFSTISSDSNLAMVNYLADFFGQLGARVFLQHNEERTKGQSLRDLRS